MVEPLSLIRSFPCWRGLAKRRYSKKILADVALLKAPAASYLKKNALHLYTVVHTALQGKFDATLTGMEKGNAS
jgi:hypothetical protein